MSYAIKSSQAPLAEATGSARRLLLPAQATETIRLNDTLWHRGWWRARWLPVSAPGGRSCVTAFRLRVQLDAAACIRIHVSGDARYRLFVDGVAVHDGPERSHPDAWRFASFDLDLPAGEHWLALRLWVTDDRGPMNQISAYPGVIVAAEGPWHDRISTGAAAWESRLLEAYTFEVQPLSCLTGPIRDGPKDNSLRTGHLA